jgi:phosphoglycerol transferase MdoB-like AlkP superfamily enzyme
MIKNGAIYFKYFLPSANGTMETLNTIITGLPDAGMHINYQKSAYAAYPMAIAVQFKKLGFKTQFFYGGYLSWQRLGDFAKAQGFDEVYGGAHMKLGQQTNEWGVDDKVLFDFITANVKQVDQPTFNVIMTTSNHPPFSINLAAENFPQEVVTKHTRKYAHELGHIWYSDKTIGAFIEKIITIDNGALFAITGDHYGRRHVAPQPSLFDLNAVPLIIYSANIKSGFTGTDIAGSHLDLAPTLIEMVAPQGFVYYSLGDSLLNKRAFNLGLGKNRIITKDFIATTDSEAIMFFNNSQVAKNIITNLKTRYAQGMCIARYIIKKGALLYDQPDHLHKTVK